MDMFSSEEEKEKERRARELNRMGIVKKKNWLKHNSNGVFPMGPPGLGRRQGECAGCKRTVWILNETGVPLFTPGDIYFLGSQTLMVGPEWASDSNKYFSVYLIFLFISF